MRVLFSILISLFCSFSYADASLPAAKITVMSTAWGGGAMYYSLEGISSVEGCSQTDTRVIAAKDFSMHDEILWLTFTAFTTKKNVVCRMSGCASNGLMKSIAVSLAD